jgi:CRISPR-associated protein (TIGR03986 family)
MAKGTIVTVKKGNAGTILSDEGIEYRFNRKRIVTGDLDWIEEGRRVEFEPDSDWASQVRLLDEVREAQAPPKSPSEPQPKAHAAVGSPSSPGGYRFLNPYNFVRYVDQARPTEDVLGDCPPPPHDRYVGLTGRIACKVEAVTPLFISDSHAVSEDADGHKTYRFFELDGQPALPASSLRGMVRSVFETVTNSCFGVYDDDTLSYHFPSTRSPWLMPARVERNGDNWKLRLLPGTTDLQIESSSRKSPEGLQYAAWSASYWPLKASKTLRAIGPKGRQLGQKQLAERRTFIDRTQTLNRNPDGMDHGEEGYALLRRFQHPHPRIRFWDVVQVRRERSALPQPRGNDERIERGWLCITNQNIEPKHSERFFFRSEQNRTGPELIELPRKARQAYEDLIRDYQKRHSEAVNRRQRKGQQPGRAFGSEAGFSRFVYQKDERTLKGEELVYALLEGSASSPRVRFIAPVSVPRVNYEHSIGQLMREDLHRCKDFGTLCPACRVFGWVYQAESGEETPQDKVTAYAGRVRFSHGTIAHSDGELPETTLAILSTPKPTTTSFYLLNAQGQPNATVDYDTSNARLRGRKFYRHHGSAKPIEYQGAAKSDQNRSVKGALKPGATFTFTLDFENLAPLELGALLYVLEPKDELFHRLGYAKPLGFGSVKVTVEKAETVDWPSRFQSLDVEAGWQPVGRIQVDELKDKFLQAMHDLYGDEFDNVLLADLQALLGQPWDNLPIHYPRTSEKPDPEGKNLNFKWFVGNKRRVGGRNLPGPVVLELAEHDTEGLPLIGIDGREGE